MADSTSATPASLQVYRYRAGADRVEAVIGTLEPEFPQEDLVVHATEALERETFMCYAVSQPDDFVADGRGVGEVPSRGAALGVRTGLQFPEDAMTLGAGATVALYTDGLTEARDPGGALYGLERLEQSLERCQEAPVRDTLQGVWDDVTAFRGDGTPTDDATLLLVRLT